LAEFLGWAVAHMVHPLAPPLLLKRLRTHEYLVYAAIASQEMQGFFSPSFLQDWRLVSAHMRECMVSQTVSIG
jgi:hypothetical protein